jgi:hypothetical protein
MNINRSSLSIHDVTSFALPTQVPAVEIPARRIDGNGCCWVCGGREDMSEEFLRQYPGEAECPSVECELIYMAELAGMTADEAYKAVVVASWTMA